MTRPRIVSLLARRRVRRSFSVGGGFSVGWALIATAALTAGHVTAQDWQALIAELRDNNAGKRIAALRQLNAANYQPAAQYAAPLVTDPDDDVQIAAIDAEITFFTNEPVGPGSSGSRALEAFNAGPLVRSAAREPDILIDQLITATVDRNARVRFDAIHAIGVIAEPGHALTSEAASRLMTGLQQSDPVMRAATARALGRIRAASAGDALIALLNDKSELVQQFAAESLGWLKYDRAVQALTDRVAFFKGDRAAQSNDALLALARIAHGSSRNLFRANLTSAQPAARRAAVEGLARVGDRASLDQIRTLAKNDPSNDVRLAGLFALNAFGEPQASGLALAVGRPDIGAQARDYLLEIGPAAAPAVAAAMTTAADPAARAELTHLIGFIGTADNTAALETMTRDPDPRAARAAADALARLRR